MRRFPLRSFLVVATASALVLVATTGSFAADSLSADGQLVVDDPGPQGDFTWKGYNWERRTSTSNWGPAYNGRWDAANVVGPDANGHITLKVTNDTKQSPVSAELSTTRRGFGYGTYTTVVEKRLDVMQPELVWGCLFTYDAHNAPGYTEIDVCEASAWGGGTAKNQPVMQTHGYWFDARLGPGEGSVASSFPAGAQVVLTHRMIWAPLRLTYETYSGHGLSGPLLKRTVLTGASVPTPAQEKLHFNFWVFEGNGGSPDRVKPETVIIRDFTFTPAGLTLFERPTASEGCLGRSYALVGDWDGSGRAGIGWWCDGRFRLRGAGGQAYAFTYGQQSGDVPVVGDWNGDGRDGVGVFRRGGQWHLRNSLAASSGLTVHSFTYGRQSGDVPVVGDWNGDGRDGVGVFRRGGQWHLRNSLTASSGLTVHTFTYGTKSGDLPVTGNWTGQGTDGVGVFRPGGQWHLRDSLSGQSGMTARSFTYGRQTGDLPVAADWSGHGRHTAAVVRGDIWHVREG